MRQIKDKGINFAAFYDNFAIFNHLPSHLVGNIQNEKNEKIVELRSCQGLEQN